MFHSKSPLYYQLAEIIIKEIKDKNLQENDRILTEREYCEKYKLSRSTVRQAIGYLEKKGYIYKVQGCGTFVSSRVMKQKLLKFYSFTEEARKQGKVPSSQILSFKKKKITDALIGHFKTKKDEKIYELQRLRLADDEIVMYEKTYLLEKKMQGLTKEELLEKPLYETLQTKYDINFTKAVERFSVLLADKTIANILKISEGSPIIKLQRWTYVGMEIIEYTVSLVRGDRFEFEVELDEN